MLWALFAARDPAAPAPWLVAVLLQVPGLLADRWFFFAQARHPQNLYYQVFRVPRSAFGASPRGRRGRPRRMRDGVACASSCARCSPQAIDITPTVQPTEKIGIGS